MSDTHSDVRVRAADGGYDVVVVGGGAAGLSAALVLARARRRVAVVDAGEPRNAPAAHLRGFLTRDGMPPGELLAAGRAELRGYGVDLLDGRVDRIVPVPGTGAPAFDVHPAEGRALRARRVVVATGLRDGLPELPDLAARWGRDVLHCPYCHGYEVRDRPLGVLGTDPGSVGQALLLRQWSADVVLLAHTLDLAGADRARLGARGVRVVEGEAVRAVVVDDRLHGVELADGAVVPREALFLVPRPEARDAPLFGLDCDRDAQGWVATDRTGRTGVPGVWAVGNLTDPRAQVITAAGAGSAAAIALNHDLVDEDTALALAAVTAPLATAVPTAAPAR
ncbi:FAD-dependent oxidoreductase [Kitasatospora purpeofusca]|uniref:NAD(P)/FAD-dependent oxidoreductase n=1 Tax=Kitasatospora purpeofusca TaxID=67352 RepID=UPI002E0EE869|nr:FAD-dependent oxidoreductase [Kitasatospora purpeofusca]WSR41409.1 FAD-dependent oxidoreductase [Kitasatospora purpeofusca]